MIKPEFVKVEGNSELFREKKSGAIINTNREKYLSFKKQKTLTNELSKRVDRLEEKIDLILQTLQKDNN